MEKFKEKDWLNLKEKNQVERLFGPNNDLLWSGELFKINWKQKWQNRDFAITKNKVYNLGKKGNFLLTFFSKKIKRSFKVEDIKAITLSKNSDNMIIHIPSEYDYYLWVPKRDEFIKTLLFALNLRIKNTIKFYVVEEVNLFQFTRYENQNLQKNSTAIAQVVNYNSFEFIINGGDHEYMNTASNTEVIVSSDGTKINEDSFEILKMLGKGKFGKVFLSEKKDNQQLFAIKVISKLEIIKRNFFENLKNEKKIMEQIKNPFLVNMEYCFSSASYVFFAMKFKQGGELYYHLRKRARFNESTAKFYACQILAGLSYLHSFNIMYRDLKPENVLLDEKGNACLADFGISKILNPRETTKSFVGTPEYIAPEMVLQKEYNRSVDVWCFGILLYEMVYGLPPFYNKNQNIMLNWVIKLDPSFPKVISVSNNLQDLILKVI